MLLDEILYDPIAKGCGNTKMIMISRYFSVSFFISLETLTQVCLVSTKPPPETACPYDLSENILGTSINLSMLENTRGLYWNT